MNGVRAKGARGGHWLHIVHRLLSARYFNVAYLLSLSLPLGMSGCFRRLVVIIQNWIKVPRGLVRDQPEGRPGHRVQAGQEGGGQRAAHAPVAIRLPQR